MAFTPVAIKDANAASKNMAALQDASGYQYALQSGDSAIPHYSAGFTQITPVASSTAVFVLIGSATKTIRVKRIDLSGIATAAAEAKFGIKKSSDAGTLGSAVLSAATAAPWDSGFAAATATFNSVGTAVYTTVPATVGYIAVGELGLPATASGVGFTPYTLEFGKNGVPAVVLRGVAQTLYVDFLGAAVPSGGKYSATVWWSEDAS